MKKSVKWGAAGLAVLMGLGLMAMKPFHHGGFGRHFDRTLDYRVDCALDEIDATDAQRAKANEIKSRLKVEMAALHKESSQRHQKLLAEVAKGQVPAKGEVDTCVEQQSVAMTKLAHHVTDGILEFSQTLSPEQRQKLAKRAEKFQKYFQEDNQQ